ncbi:MAG: hypothetical protein M3P18_24710, partial [Actinomycetota bacterium]|nr:hypothetical protein [Actinomycetota bacterium]
MCKRTTPDPLLRLFLDRYGLHLLAVPRAGASVGDVFVSDGRRTSPVGNIRHLVRPGLELAPHRGEPMADIAGRSTREVGLEAGLGVLEAFLTAIGAAGIVDAVNARYSHGSARSLAFSFEDPVRDHVDVLEVGAALLDRQLVAESVFGPGDHRYYVTTAVARSRALSVQGRADNRSAMEIGAEVVKVAEADAAVEVRLGQDGKVTYAGKDWLAFGVELFEVLPDSEAGILRLAMPGGPVSVRGPD